MASAPSVAHYPSGVRRPCQQRSNETLERILDRAETLLDGRDFDVVTILEVLEVAEVSASSLYRRFGDKQALLRALHVRHFERVRRLAEAVASNEGWDAMTLEEICDRLIRICLAHRRSQAGRIQTLRLAERQHPDFEARRHTMDLWMLKTVGDYFEKRQAARGRSFDRRAFALCCYLIACSIDAAASAPEGLAVPLRHEMDDEWLATSLTHMMCGHLGFLDLDEDELAGGTPPSACEA